MELLEGLGPESDSDDVLRAAAELLPEGPERQELGFLFSDPIEWSPGPTSITNGQHRACALKAAGAPLCVALTYGELYGEAVPGEPRRRAQSTLVEYWAVRLGRNGYPFFKASPLHRAVSVPDLGRSSSSWPPRKPHRAWQRLAVLQGARFAGPR